MNIILLLATCGALHAVGAAPADYARQSDSYAESPAPRALFRPHSAAPAPYYRPSPPVDHPSKVDRPYPAAGYRPQAPTSYGLPAAQLHNTRGGSGGGGGGGGAYRDSEPLAHVIGGKLSHNKQRESDEHPAVERPYNYDYIVSDQYSGANFAKQEDSDGKQTVGSYSVSLPDGRIQHVKYVADEYNGFNAVVTYEGEAHYPEQKEAKPAQYHDNGAHGAYGPGAGAYPSPPPVPSPRHTLQKPHVLGPIAPRPYAPPHNNNYNYNANFNQEEYGPPRDGGYHSKPAKFYTPPTVIKTQSTKVYKHEAPSYVPKNYPNPPVY